MVTMECMDPLLPYENQMLLESLTSDGLLVAAKGLGLDHVLAALTTVYSDPGNLVLVMGTSDADEEQLINTLSKDGKVPPKKITTEYSVNERKRVYLEGGVLFVTTRILVVDLLTDRLPADLVTGILLTRAHKTAESCQESFVLRLFRQKNRKGFIKGFSSAPGAIKDVNRTMRNLFLANLYLWPRFHADVTEAFKECAPEVIEIHLQMTTGMKTIQTAMLDLINFSLQELKRINPSLSSYDDLTVENAVSNMFHKLLQRELDPVWHQLSWKTKQLVADLKTLRTVLLYLTQYDCITFHAFVSALRTTENAMRSGGWMVLDAAESLFIGSRQRVFGKDEQGSLKRLKEVQAGKKLDLGFEENPKWDALSEILKEVCADLKESGAEDNFPTEKVLILTSDERTATQVQDYLALGAVALMARMFNKSLGEKYGRIPNMDGEQSAAKNVKETKNKGVGKKSSVKKDSDAPECKLQSAPAPVTIVQSMQVGSFDIHKLLDELEPRFVIMYDAEVSVVRQLEVFQAKRPDRKVRVYFLMYEKSVEEQAYLTTLRKEKEAFERLIVEKSKLVVPRDRDGRMGENPDLVRDSGKKASDTIMEKKSASIGSRKGGGEDSAKKSVEPKIIVDMREFRSELPSLVHKRGIDIEPVTIEVGDYILTPEICVERKSISDLIGSLQCGRLYNQATSMTRFYAKPMLLIEFDTDKPFALQGKYYLSKDIASTDITARLQLLTVHFPKLRILWSPSPHATAELFEELKKGREEPSAATAAAMSFDFIDDHNVDKYNPSVRDFVSKLPGITSKNVFAILNRVESLVDLLGYSKEELGDILGSKLSGDALYNGIHEKPEVPEALGKRKAAEKGPRFKSKKVKK